MTMAKFGTEEFWDQCMNMKDQCVDAGSDLESDASKRVQTVLRSLQEDAAIEMNERDCTRNGDGCTVLHYASMNGATAIVKFYLEKGAEPDLATFSYESTPMKWAACKGHKDIVELLLKSGSNQKIRDYFGYTPLQYACLGGHSGVVSILLGLNQSTDTSNNDDSQAIEDTSTLLSCFSDAADDDDVNSVDDAGFMPLHIACSLGRMGIVSVLLELGAFPDEPNQEGRTPLFFAVGCGHTQILSKLIDWGANVDAFSKTEKSLYHVSSPGWTPLHEACEKNQVECAELLLKKGAIIDTGTLGKETSLMIATQNGNFQVANLLLEKGADVDLGDDWNTTPLHVSCRQNHKKIVSLLIENGAEVNICNNYNETPLHIACWLGRFDIGRILIANGADIEARNKDNFTPLDYAKQRGHSHMAAALSVTFQKKI